MASIQDGGAGELIGGKDGGAMGTQQSNEIRVAGHLRESRTEWFDGMTLFHDLTGETVLSGELDQAGLHGMLARIRNLGLTLVSINRVAISHTGPDDCSENDE